ncbi:MAG: glycerol-3-phosphate 1-O-acyltransferase PlsY [Firmicutes bacterium]|nr:glycerol-3-phosphate 1-O-acyltransferase PlsY [Bacillota bacterium]
MFRLVCLIIGYLIGCLQFAFIVGKIMGKIDIRDFGSGNAGTTNVTRVLGAKAGAIVFICDILKGLIAFCICSAIYNGGGSFFSGESILPGLYAGVGVILGHDFPFYLRFRGGKGIASTVGIIFCIDPVVAAVTYAVGLGSAIITKYISLCSLLMTLICPIMMIVRGMEKEAVILMFAVMALAYYQHRTNIKRLLSGSENKFGVKKKEKE